MIPDRRLSANFTLYDLTRTTHAHLQAQNRELTPEQIAKLEALASLLEVVLRELGGDLGARIDVHSAFRCLALNILVGSSEKSQHLLCEAADVSPGGPDTHETIEAAFNRLVVAARQGRLRFGQLIIESAKDGREGRKFWIHVSLGAPYRAAARCGEVFKIVDGKTTFIERIA